MRRSQWKTGKLHNPIETPNLNKDFNSNLLEQERSSNRNGSKRCEANYDTLKQVIDPEQKKIKHIIKHIDNNHVKDRWRS